MPRALYKRKAGDRMKPDDIVRYADRIYGYAVKRTFSRDEADELSQEILCAAVRSQPAGTTAGKAALRARRILCAGRVKPGPRGGGGGRARGGGGGGGKGLRKKK